MAAYFLGGGVALVAFLVGWTFGALWAHKRTVYCKTCEVARLCPRCHTMYFLS